MKRILLVAFGLILALILVNRERVYLRDPVASVYRNDVKQDGVQVFMNYSSEVLLEQEAELGAYRILVQAGQTPGTPARLTCIHWMACLTEADHPPVVAVAWTGKGRYSPDVTVAGREVSFVDGDGARIRVVLR